MKEMCKGEEDPSKADKERQDKTERKRSSLRKPNENFQCVQHVMIV